MNRRRLLAMAAGAAITRPVGASAQQNAMPLIGFLSSQSSESYAHFADEFRRGLGKTGYVEGRNLAIEYRWAKGDLGDLPAMAADLVRHNVTVISATGGLASARAAAAATATIPIVFNFGGDPVQAGLVASFNRPGGNITGVSWFTTDLTGKRLALMRDLVPTATVLALLWNPDDPETASQPTAAEAAVRSLGCQLVVAKASTPGEIDTAFAALAEQRVGALVVGAGAFWVSHRAQTIALAARYAIPTLQAERNSVADGGLIYYGNDLADAYRRNGAYVGRILNGERPADLPIDRSSKFELLINLHTAKALGLTVPQILLAQADEVIE